MAGSLNDTIEKLKAEIGEHVSYIKREPAWEQIDKLYRALGTIEELAETPRTSLVELFGIEDGTGKSTRVKQGEYYGLEPLEAAKRFLKKRGEATSLDTIMEALATGGVQAERDAVRISLSRSTWDVAKVGTDIYGLVDFYPHLKRGARGKKPSVVAAVVGAESTIATALQDETSPDEPTGT
jgi:hypothetical protein